MFSQINFDRNQQYQFPDGICFILNFDETKQFHPKSSIFLCREYVSYWSFSRRVYGGMRWRGEDDRGEEEVERKRAEGSGPVPLSSSIPPFHCLHPCLNKKHLHFQSFLMIRHPPSPQPSLPPPRPPLQPAMLSPVFLIFLQVPPALHRLRREESEREEERERRGVQDT